MCLWFIALFSPAIDSRFGSRSCATKLKTTAHEKKGAARGERRGVGSRFYPVIIFLTSHPAHIKLKSRGRVVRVTPLLVAPLSPQPLWLPATRRGPQGHKLIVPMVTAEAQHQLRKGSQGSRGSSHAHCSCAVTSRMRRSAMRSLSALLWASSNGCCSAPSPPMTVHIAYERRCARRRGGSTPGRDSGW